MKARGPTPSTAIGTTPPTTHTRLTSTSAPRPHDTPQEQPAARSEARVLARARVEGRHDGLAAARGEARQQPRRRRREGADPGPHSKHRPPEKSSPSMSPAPPPFFFGRPGLFEGARTSRARRSFAAAAAMVAPRVLRRLSKQRPPLPRRPWRQRPPRHWSPPSQRRLPRKPTSKPRGCPRGGPARRAGHAHAVARAACASASVL